MTIGGPLSIVFVESDLAATGPLRAELERRGARVDLSPTATGAVEESKAHPPDLIVLDESRMKIGEEDALPFFAERLPDTEVILLHSGTDVMPHGSGMGLLFSAHKPVSKATMLEVIESAFPGRLKVEVKL
jgi:DNA-binding NtrC family response regulator